MYELEGDPNGDGGKDPLEDSGGFERSRETVTHPVISPRDARNYWEAHADGVSVQESSALLTMPYNYRAIPT